MNIERLLLLLTQPESATLEFKRKPYNLDSDNAETKKRQRDELIKDILSLANGSPTTVGDKAYLIIGADDKCQADDNRQLFDVAPDSLTKQRILSLVNPACQPRLQDIECEPVVVEGKRLLIITIWPTPYLHETTRDLTTSGGNFSKYTVFTRHDENSEVASQREREAIYKLKQFHFADTRKVSPAKFGAVLGGIVGGAMASTPAKTEIELPVRERINRGIVGTVVSAGVGWLLGGAYTQFLEFTYEWHFLPKRKRVVLVPFLSISMIFFWWVYYKVWSLLRDRFGQRIKQVDK